MLKVFGCLVDFHDLRLVGLAATVCVLASLTMVRLLRHARACTDRSRFLWITVAAVSGGFGIWATHFIAMLAYSPGIPFGYNIPTTVISLLAAVTLTGTGLFTAIVGGSRFAAWIGGAIVGGGIAAMHFLGMAAFEVAGHKIWDSGLVVAAVGLGAAIGACALPMSLRDGPVRWRLAGALLLTLAICGHHFTAMGAVSVVFDPTVVVSERMISTAWLAVAVALASFAIILLACLGLYLDLLDRRRAVRETSRMRGLANAAIEGLVICDRSTIIAVNDSFASLVGIDPEVAMRARPDQFFPDMAAFDRLAEAPNVPVESEVRSQNGSIPVELILRPIEFGGTIANAIAVRDLRDRKKAEAHILYLAHHDALTGLPNRARFNDRLDLTMSEVEAAGGRLAILCFDLDRFKEVNDLFGHAAGDAVLQSVVRCVMPLLTPGQMLARLGGDEFAVIMPEIRHPNDAGRLAERALAALHKESEASATATFVSASIGIAIFPDDAVDRAGLLTQADTALYKAKSEGRATYRFFESTMGAEVRERRLIEHELRHAIARDELRLVYQPQIQVSTGEIVGFEALLRWRHTSRGDVAPSIFIPIAEDSGSILLIGEWVMRAACTEAMRWTSNLSIAVNVSPHQIHHAGFARMVEDVLAETGLPAARLELEITEMALVRDLERTLSTLRRLKVLGIRIAMDDFGTGYSSLSNLRAFPFDKIKVDRSFVRSVDSNEEAATIVRAVMGLGKGLHLPVVAEGVETIGELDFLRAENCAEVQGYLLGHPGDISQFADVTHGAEARVSAGSQALPRTSACPAADRAA